MANIDVQWYFCSSSSKIPSTSVGDYSLYFCADGKLFQDINAGQPLTKIADVSPTALGNMISSNYYQNIGSANTNYITDHALYANNAGSVPNGTSIQQIEMAHNGTVISTEIELNLIDSKNILVTLIDNNGKADTTFTISFPNWLPNTSYVIGDCVINGGTLCQCNTAHTSSTVINLTYWTVISGNGTVTSVASANTDLSIATPTTTPVITVNSGTGANQLLKLNSNAKVSADLITDGTTNAAYTQTEKTKLSGINAINTTTNSGTAYSVSITNYSVGVPYYIKINSAIAAASTLSVNSGTAYSIVDATGANITSIAANSVICIYQNTSTSNYQRV